ncbi:hypothetical protein FB451DRAFT_1301111 [Mycena latifolia]|nr:hypothetical protein FB451DRAFT_1301111 [Mycena latifolia]
MRGRLITAIRMFFAEVLGGGDPPMEQFVEVLRHNSHIFEIGMLGGGPRQNNNVIVPALTLSNNTGRRSAPSCPLPRTYEIPHLRRGRVWTWMPFSTWLSLDTNFPSCTVVRLWKYFPSSPRQAGALFTKGTRPCMCGSSP